MKPLFSAIALTLFPDMFPGPLGQSLAGTALKKNLWSLEAIDIRTFATDKHRTVDDSPYGGGTGMVMKPDVVDTAVEYALSTLSHRERGGTSRGEGMESTSPHPNPPPNGEGIKPPRLIYTSPRGVPFTQKLAEELKDTSPVILCGRFEGVDQRVIEHHDMLEISLGDFVLSGGEIAAYAILDAIVRLLPGVIGKESALHQESFAISDAKNASPQQKFAGLLEYPHYTRPSSWKGKSVPDVLLSGNHEQINTWRLEQAKQVTAQRRPDLIKKSTKEQENE